MHLTLFREDKRLYIARQGTAQNPVSSLQEKWLVVQIELQNLLETKNQLLQSLESLNRDIGILHRTKPKHTGDIVLIRIAAISTGLPAHSLICRHRPTLFLSLHHHRSNHSGLPLNVLAQLSGQPLALPRAEMESVALDRAKTGPAVHAPRLVHR